MVSRLTSSTAHIGPWYDMLGCSFACLKIFPHFLGCIWRWGFAAAGGWGSLPLAAAAGELPALRGRGQVPEQKFRQGLMWNGGVSAEDSWSVQDMVFFGLLVRSHFLRSCGCFLFLCLTSLLISVYFRLWVGTRACRNARIYGCRWAGTRMSL